MAIAEEAEKGSRGEGGGGRGTSGGSRRGADTSPRKKKKKKARKDSGKGLISCWNHQEACIITIIVFSHHRLHDIFCTVLGGKQGVGGGEESFNYLAHTNEPEGPDSASCPGESENHPELREICCGYYCY